MLKCQEIIHFSVFIAYQYIILLASPIYFLRGVSRPQRSPGSAPDISSLNIVMSYLAIASNDHAVTNKMISTRAAIINVMGNCM